MRDVASRPAQTPERLERLLPILVWIQQHLGADLSLEALAARAGWSPAHFHKEFRALVGETPKQHCLRLRLERAAVRLVLMRDSIRDVALRCGFERHETFTRAFVRRFGTTPRAFRGGERSTGVTSLPATAVEPPLSISRARVEQFADFDVAFVRHVGPYEQVPGSLFDRVRRFAEQRGFPEPLVMLGIAHDPPGITAPERMRFDAAVRAPGPFRGRGAIAHQVLRGGPWGVVTHVGPHATLSQAYQRAVADLGRLRRYRLVGLPSVEIYHTTPIAPALAIHRTDVCLPLSAG